MYHNQTGLWEGPVKVRGPKFDCMVNLLIIINASKPVLPFH